MNVRSLIKTAKTFLPFDEVLNVECLIYDDSQTTRGKFKRLISSNEDVLITAAANGTALHERGFSKLAVPIT